MITNPGILDKKVDIYTDTTSSSGDFDQVKAKLLYKRVSAAIQPMRGSAYREAQLTETKALLKITIRYRKDVTTAAVIVYHDHVYRVIDCIDPDMSHESLELMCNEIKRGVTPTKKPSEEWEP